MSDLQYCICNSKLISIVNGKQICKTCGKEKMPVSPRSPIIKRKVDAPPRNNIEALKG